jgi:hypothetical protein
LEEKAYRDSICCPFWVMPDRGKTPRPVQAGITKEDIDLELG